MKRTPSLLRDALTGAALELGPDAVIYRLHDTDPRAIPARIDKREPYHVDGARSWTSTKRPVHRNYAGGFEWSTDFERYIRKALPKSIAEARRAWREWWTVPVVVERLAAHMGAEKLQAALLVLRDGVSEHAVARRYNHTLGWVQRCKSEAVHLVRSKYLPHIELKHYVADFAESFEPSKPVD